MSISIIIPTCNRNDLLKLCLTLLTPSAQEYPAGLYEIIVSDDSPTDSARLLINENFPVVTWTAGPRKGPAANRNNGARLAKNEWLLFIDDDCLPSKTLLKEYALAIENNEGISVFEGAISADRDQQNLIEECPINLAGGHLWSCNFMIHKDLFFTMLEGFDEKFPYAAMEDVDLKYRLQKLNTSICFIKSATVVHPWRIQSELYAMSIKRFESTRYFLNKHPEKKAEINSLYFVRAFYNGFIKNTLKNSLKYKFNGFLPKVKFDFLQLYFAFQLLVTRR